MAKLNKIKEKWNAIPLEIKASTSYAICSILQRCLSIITISLFARLLTTEQYGQYTVYTSWSSLLIILITLNLAYGSFSTAMVKFETRRDEYIASVEGICLLLAALFLIIYLPFRSLWNQLFELPTVFIIIMVLEILASTAITLWSGKQRFEFRYKGVIAITLFTSVIAPCVAFVLVLNSEEKGYARIFGYAVTTIITGGTIFIYNLLKGKKLYIKEFWKYAFGFNVPLLVYYVSQMIFGQSDRIMISHYCGTDKAAMYGVSYNLAMILTFVLNAINNSYLPWFYGKLKTGRQKESESVTNAIALLMAGLLLCVIWFAPEIIYIMAGKNYTAAVWVVPPVAMSLLLYFYVTLSTNVEFYFEEKKALVVASVGAAVVNIVLNALFIEKYGYVIAGYTTLVSYVIFAIANYLVMKRILRKRKIDEDGYDWKTLVLIFIVFAIIGVIGMLLYDYLIVRIIITIVGGLFLLKFRKNLIQYFKRIRGEFR